MASKRTAPRAFGENAETLFARDRWEKLRASDPKLSAKEMARRIGVRPSAVSQLVNSKNGLGARSIAGWARALGFRSVADFRVAAYRWYLAVYELHLSSAEVISYAAPHLDAPGR